MAYLQYLLGVYSVDTLLKRKIKGEIFTQGKSEAF